MDTYPKILKGVEHTNSSENTTEQYESLVQQEDEHIERLKTCTKLIFDALAIISQKASNCTWKPLKKRPTIFISWNWIYEENCLKFV